MSEVLTRTVYWSPAGTLNPVLEKSTYFFLFLALCLFFYGLWRHIKLWQKGKKERCFDKPFLRLFFLLKYVFFQAKNFRKSINNNLKKTSSYSAIMHSLVFYGFLSLVHGTTIVFLKDYNIIDLYSGTYYAFVKVSCQIGGICLIIGLAMGIFRRSSKDNSFKHSKGYTVFYFLLFILVLQGFLLQGLRLSHENKAPDKLLASVGLIFSYLFPKNLEKDTANYIYSSLWFFHMITTMAFLAVIPFTRAMHMVTATLNIFTKRLRPDVTLKKMSFSDDSLEYFGPKKVTDFSWKDLLSFDSCTECQRCSDVCPANQAQKPLDPRNVILKLRDSMLSLTHSLGKNKNEDALFESGVISQNEVWSCTNCGACVTECPVSINQLSTIMELKRYQTLTLGALPPKAAQTIANIKQYKNPWGLPAAKRFSWAQGLDVPVISEDSPEVEYLYYVGCAGSYDASNQKVVKAIIEILKFCKVSFAVLGKKEQCNGDPLKRFGDEYSFSEVALSNVKQLSKLKFKKILTHCPHCYSTLKHDFRDYGGNYTVLHHTQLLSLLIKNGNLKLNETLKTEATFHDPCFLGRHNGEYDAPRNILNHIKGLKLHEMTFNKSKSNCCGMGGGNMWHKIEEGESIAKKRLTQVKDTHAKTLVTGCSFCLINFKSTFDTLKKDDDLEILDIAQVVKKALHK